MKAAMARAKADEAEAAEARLVVEAVEAVEASGADDGVEARGTWSSGDGATIVLLLASSVRERSLPTLRHARGRSLPSPRPSTSAVCPPNLWPMPLARSPPAGLGLAAARAHALPPRPRADCAGYASYRPLLLHRPALVARRVRPRRAGGSRAC